MRKRSKADFDEWVEKARPAFTRYADSVAAIRYGLALCSWLDWLDDRKLAWRGEIRWQIPTQGPLLFTPPSTEGLMARLAEIVGELGLEGTIARSARCSAAPTQKTRGARGPKMARSLTVRK